MASIKTGSTDYFGTFLETVQKRRSAAEHETRDVPTALLVALRGGTKPVSELVETNGPTITEVLQALDQLEKFGLVTFQTTADGSKTVRLTGDGARAAEKAS